MSAQLSLDDQIKPLLGLPCWNVQRGHGSFLTFEFGEPHLKVGEPHRRPAGARVGGLTRPAFVHGDWHLWVYCCHWEASYGGEVLAHSESVDEEIDVAARALNGQALTCVALDGTLATFDFDLGGRLVTRPNDAGDEQWLLYAPMGKVVTFTSEGTLELGMADEPRST